MPRSRYPADRGLSARMAFTVFAIGLLFVAFIVALWALKVPIVLVAVIAVVVLGGQYWFADRIAMFSMKAHEVSPADAPELHAIVDRLCALANLPKPKVAIAENDVPNAFATGRNQRSAVVAVTTGLLARLDDAEVEAVLAHELSHVAHRDVAVMTVASLLGLLAGLLTRFAMYAGFFGGFGSSDNDNEDNSGLVFLAVLAVSALVYGLSFLLTRALSRYRELAADRGAAIVTGAPATLAAALVKVTGEMARIPTQDLRAAEPMNAFFFAPALAPGFSLSSLFSTHPSLEQRLDQLARIQTEMGSPA